MKIYFITTNKDKFNEVKDILKDYPVELENLDIEYTEDHDQSMDVIAKTAAKKLADELKKPIVLEDTGLFFDAYNNFPGALPKFVIKTIGFKGIFKLLDGESRKAYFQTFAAFCEPGKEPVLFEGVMKGEIIREIPEDKETEYMPYDLIFIPEGGDRTISKMTLQEKNSFSQRAKSFKKFGKYIKNDRT